MFPVLVVIHGVLVLGWFLFASASKVGAQAPIRLGEEFQVNTYTTDRQGYAAVSASPDGQFVVVWRGFADYNGDADTGSVQGQRFMSNGTPLGHQFLVNTYTEDSQWMPSIGHDGSGNFVVVWEGFEPPDDPYGWSIRGQRFASDGQEIDGEFLVNSGTFSDQDSSSMGINRAGDFVAVWHSRHAERGIYGQRFSSTGETNGDEFRVSSYPSIAERFPAVAISETGNFLVVWDSRQSSQGDQSWSIQGQHFDASGIPVGGQFIVNTYTTGYQRRPDVAVDGSGNFIVVWDSQGPDLDDNSGRSIRGQRYASDGTPSGANFLVNTYTTGEQREPAIVAHASGHFVVVWESRASGTSADPYYSVRGQRFSSSGEMMGDLFQVNTYTTRDQEDPKIAMDREGNFVVVWHSDGSSGSDTDYGSIQGQRFCAVECAHLFSDGFESGDVSSWSMTSP